jgi:hypothetical protein
MDGRTIDYAKPTTADAATMASSAFLTERVEDGLRPRCETRDGVTRVRTVRLPALRWILGEGVAALIAGALGVGIAGTLVVAIAPPAGDFLSLYLHLISAAVLLVALCFSINSIVRAARRRQVHWLSYDRREARIRLFVARRVVERRDVAAIEYFESFDGEVRLIVAATTDGDGSETIGVIRTRASVARAIAVTLEFDLALPLIETYHRWPETIEQWYTPVHGERSRVESTPQLNNRDE